MNFIKGETGDKATKQSQRSQRGGEVRVGGQDRSKKKNYGKLMLRTLHVFNGEGRFGGG